MTIDDASAMGIFLFDRGGQIVAFEEKPARERLEEIGRSIPAGATFARHTDDKPFIASMGVYVFSRKVLLDMLARDDAKDFGREIIPAALDQFRVQSHLFGGYWADVGTVDSFYRGEHHAHAPRRAVHVLRSAPAHLYASALPAGIALERLLGAQRQPRGGLLPRSLHGRGIDRRHPHDDSAWSRRPALGPPRRGLLRHEDEAAKGGGRPPLGIGRDVVLDRVIVDKNARIGDGARLVNEGLLREFDGDGFFIRDGVIVVPKDGVISPGRRRNGSNSACPTPSPSRVLTPP